MLASGFFSRFFTRLFSIFNNFLNLSVARLLSILSFHARTHARTPFSTFVTTFTYPRSSSSFPNQYQKINTVPIRHCVPEKPQDRLNFDSQICIHISLRVCVHYWFVFTTLSISIYRLSSFFFSLLFRLSNNVNKWKKRI